MVPSLLNRTSSTGVIGHDAFTEEDGFAFPPLDIHDISEWRQHIDKTDRALIEKAGYKPVVFRVLVQPNTIQEVYIQEEPSLHFFAATVPAGRTRG